ncbi:MAG: DUF1501 domain-containing protein [Bacteroidota bacterium]|nr:DUF1501 domain-containing protein [Bacteroidota bacterium]
MKLSRRDFLKTMGSLGGGAMLMLNGIPVRAMSATNTLNRIIKQYDTDNILVLIQLHGGNDGLNTFVPLDQYQDYYNIRANVALPRNGRRGLITLDENLPNNQQLGLHPDILGFKNLYDEGSAAFVQNVGYENTNMSHFRARDIFFMGGDYNQNFASGWMGRFLNYEYPGYPENYPSTDHPDPLALELGNAHSLAFHRENGIPMGLSIANPQAFYDLISGVGGPPPVAFPDSYYGDELQYLMQMEDQANGYAERLRYLYDNGTVADGIIYTEKYPLNAPPQYRNNPLSEQFRILSHLISGGSNTRIYVIRMGGFDTHADQVEPYDNTMGRHAALVHHLSASVKTFYDDLKKQGLDERVVTMTFSEFGRRVYSNAGYGTDHGKAAPLMLFGPALKGGVYGNNPDLSDLDRGNLKYKFDYRQVYTSVLKDWLGASDEALSNVYFDDFVDSRLDLFGTADKKDPKSSTDIHRLYDCYPNPAKHSVTFSYYLSEQTDVTVSLYKINGEKAASFNFGKQEKGEHKKKVDISHLPKGSYLYTFKADKISKTLSLIIM